MNLIKISRFNYSTLIDFLHYKLQTCAAFCRSCKFCKRAPPVLVLKLTLKYSKWKCLMKMSRCMYFTISFLIIKPYVAFSSVAVCLSFYCMCLFVVVVVSILSDYLTTEYIMLVLLVSYHLFVFFLLLLVRQKKTFII